VRLENDRLRRYGRPIAVVSADIDDLKAVNDRDGHLAGDALIRAAAELLRAHARATDRVARVGGDEFLVLLPETHAKGAASYVRRVRAAARRVDTGTAPTGLALSLGFAAVAPDETIEAAVQRADKAMYTAKRRRSAGRR